MRFEQIRASKWLTRPRHRRVVPRDPPEGIFRCDWKRLMWEGRRNGAAPRAAPVGNADGCTADCRRQLSHRLQGAGAATRLVTSAATGVAAGADAVTGCPLRRPAAQASTVEHGINAHGTARSMARSNVTPAKSSFAPHSRRRSPHRPAPQECAWSAQCRKCGLFLERGGSASETSIKLRSPFETGTNQIPNG